jgi:hypothetical protein
MPITRLRPFLGVVTLRAVIARRIVISRRSKFTSSHLSPSISPRRTPVENRKRRAG